MLGDGDLVGRQRRARRVRREMARLATRPTVATWVLGRVGEVCKARRLRHDGQGCDGHSLLFIIQWRAGLEDGTTSLEHYSLLCLRLSTSLGLRMQIVLGITIIFIILVTMASLALTTRRSGRGQITKVVDLVHESLDLLELDRLGLVLVLVLPEDPLVFRGDDGQETMKYIAAVRVKASIR